MKRERAASERPTVARPWLVGVACLLLAGLLTAWGVARGFAPVSGAEAAAVALLLAALLGLAWPALARHLAAARAARGPYWRRHVGLTWAAVFWSAMTYLQVRRDARAGSLEERVWLFLYLGAATAFVVLWVGLLFRRGLEHFDAGGPGARGGPDRDRAG